MGFHVCKYCRDERSSSSVVLNYGPSAVFEVPQMILHYIADHGFLPPSDFVDAVLNKEIKQQGRFEKLEPVPIGFLEGDFEKGEIPCGLFIKLWSDIRKASKQGTAIQTRGIMRGKS